MTFNRTCSSIDFSYRLDELSSTRVADDGNLDLGFKFNHSLNPGSHIYYICCKGLKTLRIIMRLSKDFYFEFFSSLVRLVLEYGVLFGTSHCRGFVAARKSSATFFEVCQFFVTDSL